LKLDRLRARESGDSTKNGGETEEANPEHPAPVKIRFEPNAASGVPRAHPTPLGKAIRVPIFPSAVFCMGMNFQIHQNQLKKASKTTNDSTPGVAYSEKDAEEILTSSSGRARNSL
jgi:hypothetical protein